MVPSNLNLQIFLWIQWIADLNRTWIGWLLFSLPICPTLLSRHSKETPKAKNNDHPLELIPLTLILTCLWQGGSDNGKYKQAIHSIDVIDKVYFLKYHKIREPKKSSGRELRDHLIFIFQVRKLQARESKQYAIGQRLVNIRSGQWTHVFHLMPSPMPFPFYMSLQNGLSCENPG